MDVLRTPDRRFRALEDYPYVPNYVDVPDNEGGYLRMHYVDEGPRNAAQRQTAVGCGWRGGGKR